MHDSSKCRLLPRGTCARAADAECRQATHEYRVPVGTGTSDPCENRRCRVPAGASLQEHLVREGPPRVLCRTVPLLRETRDAGEHPGGRDKNMRTGPPRQCVRGAPAGNPAAYAGSRTSHSSWEGLQLRVAEQRAMQRVLDGRVQLGQKCMSTRWAIGCCSTGETTGRQSARIRHHKVAHTRKK